MMRRHLSEDILQRTPERALLVGVCLAEQEPEACESSLSELQQLARTAGAEVAAVIFQRRARPHAATFIGRGKIEEIGQQLPRTHSDVVIFDNNLTPTWQRNLEHALGCKVVDRTELILDIFAQHAKTRDGKLQVELAQLRYRLPRLVGKGSLMSRLGGGIGTRGPGETQLEIDRRRITERIGKLKRILGKVRSHRSSQRKSRRRAAVPTVAIVGYTNAGKSTLLNLLSGAGVPCENQLFATLDTTTRRVELAEGETVLLTDTVGFIQNLPEDLRVAFRATLEEVTEADALLHVVDASSPTCCEQIEAVLKVLEVLDAGDKPTLTVLNKIDLVGDRGRLRNLRREYTPVVDLSALVGLGKTELLEALARLVRKSMVRFRVCVPYDKGPVLALLHEQGRILEERFEPEGVVLRAEASRYVFEKVTRYVSEQGPAAKVQAERYVSRKAI